MFIDPANRFAKEIRNCTTNITLVLAENTQNGVNIWKHFKSFNLDIRADEILLDIDHLKSLKRLSYINQDHRIMATFVHNKWDDLKKTIGNELQDTQTSVERKILNPMFENISNNSLSAKDTKEILKDKYASKLTILNASKSFGAYENHRMNYKIIALKSK